MTGKLSQTIEFPDLQLYPHVQSQSLLYFNRYIGRLKEVEIKIEGDYDYLKFSLPIGNLSLKTSTIKYTDPKDLEKFINRFNIPIKLIGNAKNHEKVIMRVVYKFET